MFVPANVLVCFLLGALRLHGETSVAFQAIAHVYVGGLFVVGWFRKRTVYVGGSRWFQEPGYWRLAWALSLVELYAGLRSHGVL